MRVFQFEFATINKSNAKNSIQSIEVAFLKSGDPSSLDSSLKLLADYQCVSLIDYLLKRYIVMDFQLFLVLKLTTDTTRAGCKVS